MIQARHDLVVTELPEFIKACQACKDGEIEAVILTILAFYDEPDLFYCAMEYAFENGATVMLAPDLKVDTLPGHIRHE